MSYHIMSCRVMSCHVISHIWWYCSPFVTSLVELGAQKTLAAPVRWPPRNYRAVRAVQIMNAPTWSSYLQRLGKTLWIYGKLGKMMICLMSFM